MGRSAVDFVSSDTLTEIDGITKMEEEEETTNTLRWILLKGGGGIARGVRQACVRSHEVRQEPRDSMAYPLYNVNQTAAQEQRAVSTEHDIHMVPKQTKSYALFTFSYLAPPLSSAHPYAHNPSLLNGLCLSRC